MNLLPGKSAGDRRVWKECASGKFQQRGAGSHFRHNLRSPKEFPGPGGCVERSAPCEARSSHSITEPHRQETGEEDADALQEWLSGSGNFGARTVLAVTGLHILSPTRMPAGQVSRRAAALSKPSLRVQDAWPTAFQVKPQSLSSQASSWHLEPCTPIRACRIDPPPWKGRRLLLNPRAAGRQSGSR